MTDDPARTQTTEPVPDDEVIKRRSYILPAEQLPSLASDGEQNHPAPQQQSKSAKDCREKRRQNSDRADDDEGRDDRQKSTRVFSTE